MQSEYLAPLPYLTPVDGSGKIKILQQQSTNKLNNVGRKGGEQIMCWNNSETIFFHFECANDAWDYQISMKEWYYAKIANTENEKYNTN